MVTLEEITYIEAPIERCFDLARRVEVHLAGNIHSGETAIAVRSGHPAEIVSGLIGLGQRVTWRAKHFGVWQTLTSEITAMEPPTYFQDKMVRGIFRFMKHDHLFRSLPRDMTEMTDRFSFAAPLPVLGRVAELLFLQRYMAALLHERNIALKEIAERE